MEYNKEQAIKDFNKAHEDFNKEAEACGGYTDAGMYFSLYRDTATILGKVLGIDRLEELEKIELE